MKNIIGTKIGMIQVFDVNGKVLPVTVVHCEPNKVLEVKTKAKHGSDGVKVGYLTIDVNKLSKPKAGIFKKLGFSGKRIIRSFNNMPGLKVGDDIKVDSFIKGEYVDAHGVSKGHGYTGAIKRWNFKIGPLSHGAGWPHRFQGSVAFGRGGSAPQRVPKGKKMAGHWGHDNVTVQNLVVVDVIAKRDLLLILGAIPGPEGSIVTISTSKKFPNKRLEYTVITKELQEEILKQNESLADKEALHAANAAAEAEAKKEQEAAEAKRAQEAQAREKAKEAADKAAKTAAPEKK